VIPKDDLFCGARLGNDVELGPIYPRVFGRIETLETLVGHVEAKNHSGKIEVREVTHGMVFENVIRIINDENAKIRHVAEDPADGEPRGAGLAEGGCGPGAIETSEVEGAIRLEFYDLVGAHRRVPGVVKTEISWLYLESRLFQGTRRIERSD
jgi:hypothetical protein